MACLLLPARSDIPFYSFKVELEGAVYRLEVRWNRRDTAWYLSLYDALDAIVVAGRKVVLGAPLLGRLVDPRLPPGMLLAMDTSGQNLDAGETDLGDRVQLVYVESTTPL